MRTHFPTYLADPHPTKFENDLWLASIKLFAQFGQFPSFDSDRFQSIRRNWIDLASSWSMRIPTRNGEKRDEPAPTKLSHIKQAGLLMWCIKDAHSIVSIDSYDALADKTPKDILDRLQISVGSKNPNLLLEYPDALLGFYVARSCFERMQRERTDGKCLTHDNIPRSDHFTHNVCVLMEENAISYQGCYMMFKSFDLYGFKPDPKIEKRPNNRTTFLSEVGI